MKLKRLSVPWATKKKSHKFIIAPRGPHALKDSLPLTVVIRDMLDFAKNSKEAKMIIKGREVKIDGKINKDTRYGVGLFDVIELGGKYFRLLPGKKMKLVEISSKEGNLKICKVKNKKVVKKGKIQLNLHDGKNILVDKTDVNVNDSVLIELPEQKINKHIKFESGVLVLITQGKHAGEIAKLKKFESGLNKRIWLERGKQEFESSLNAVMAIGFDKPEVSLGE